MSLPVEVARRFVSRHRIFIETGTNNGDGVQCALDAGFQMVVSIEFYPMARERAKRRFSGDGRVAILQGDSAVELGRYLTGVHEPALFWLDAHFMSGMEVSQPLATPCPVLRELEAILRHQVKTHTILIDDIRVFRTGIPQWKGIRLEEIVEAVMRINPKYAVSYADGYEPFDILVAEALYN